MPSITTPQQATMLQLQYIAEACDLRRTYLNAEEDDKGVPRGEITATKVAPPMVFDSELHKDPNIKWHPSYHTYEERVRRLAALSEERPTVLPQGFPQYIDAPRSYVIQLSPLDIAEVEKALSYFKTLPGHNGPEQVTVETFPLPTLGKKLAIVTTILHSGAGFSILRGLDPTKHSPLDNVLLYLGITSYIAEIRGCQDYDGRMIVHIKDMEKDLPEETGRPSPYTSRAQPFHTDRCDILAMYALNVAAVGGESLLASSGKIYNEIAVARPDVINVLADEGWIFDEFVTPASWHSRPLLHNFDEHGPSFCYSRRPLTGAPFSPHIVGVPTMTEIQAEALDMVHFTASKHQLQIKLERGDIEIFNNLALMHARNGFVDDTSHRSHAIRLWLKNETMAWKRPEALQSQSVELYDENGFRSHARWDVDRAPFVPKVVTRHMTCS